MSEAASIGNQKVRAVSLPSHVAAIISKCSRLLGMLSVFAMLAAICIEVFSRGALGSATIWVTEVTTYLVVITTFVGAAFVESRSANVRIELVVDSLRPSRRQYVMEALRWIAVVAILVALWRSAGLLMQNYITGSRSWSLLNTPLWMPQTSVVFGLTGLVFVLAFGAKPHGGLSGYLLFPFLVAAVLFDALQWFSLGVPPVQGVALIAAATLLIAILCSGVTVAAIAVAITAPLLGVFILAGSAALAVKSALLIAALFLLLLSGLPVAFSLLATGIISDGDLVSTNEPQLHRRTRLGSGQHI
jgi:TRAP-type C4-dicarboxylate transport system permease small subunit